MRRRSQRGGKRAQTHNEHLHLLCNQIQCKACLHCAEQPGGGCDGAGVGVQHADCAWRRMRRRFKRYIVRERNTPVASNFREQLPRESATQSWRRMRQRWRTSATRKKSQIVETMHSPLAQRYSVVALIVVVPLIHRACHEQCWGRRQRR